MSHTILTFKFDGGDADDHQLDIYDAARFQYGAARFIYTLEVLRQKGKVPRRIYRDSIKADYRISAAEPKCFLQSVISFSAPIIADNYIRVSIEHMIAFAFDKMFPRKFNDQTAIDLALGMSTQETERFKLMLEKDKITSQERQILYGLLEKAFQMGTHPEKQEHIKKVIANENAAIARKKLLDEYPDEIAKISDQNIQDLIAVNRSQMGEMGVPLKRSAETLSVFSGDIHEVPLKTMDFGDLVYLEGNRKDQEATDMLGTIKSWDKETGWGKWRSLDQKEPISFLVHAKDRATVKDKVLDMMKREELWLRFFVVRDPNRVPRYLVFDSLLEDLDVADI